VTARSLIVAPWLGRAYAGRFRVGGGKLTIDGSAQSKTAWLTRPYFVPPPGQRRSYVGYPAATREQVIDAVTYAFTQKFQLLTHANGDAATDLLMEIVRDLAKTYPDYRETRPVLVHGQVLREDQVDDLKELGIFPSLFPMHTFYWGDYYRSSVLGPERSQVISPTGWVREREMMFGTHHDAPVALPDAMRVLSATVTRRTRSGYVLGPAQRVDAMTALKAMTIWPAWQHFEEATKGSLEVGKQADLVILSADPTAVDPLQIEKIQVVETIKAGQSIYRRRD
jgi:predicted amidohydrolase YtcJ